tara:strand:+ start:348 stop:632 length:285 start_codon:yes stop_codon:yes gene_type:complete
MTVLKCPELSDGAVILQIPRYGDAQVRFKLGFKPATGRMIEAVRLYLDHSSDKRASLVALSHGPIIASEKRYLYWTLAHLAAIVVLFVLFGGGT